MLIINQDLCLHVLVQARFPVPSSGDLDYGKRDPQGPADSDNVEKKVFVVVSVVFIDTAPLNNCYPLSGAECTKVARFSAVAAATIAHKRITEPNFIIFELFSVIAVL